MLYFSLPSYFCKRFLPFTTEKGRISMYDDTHNGHNLLREEWSESVSEFVFNGHKESRPRFKVSPNRPIEAVGTLPPHFTAEETERLYPKSQNVVGTPINLKHRCYFPKKKCFQMKYSYFLYLKVSMK